MTSPASFFTMIGGLSGHREPTLREKVELQKCIGNLTRRRHATPEESEKRTQHIGCVGGIDYGILIERVGVNSMNGTSNDEPHFDSLRRVIRSLKFNDIVGYPGELESWRRVMVLGRLSASHHPHQRHSQSRWIIVMDRTKMLWALYPDNMDEDDSMDEECKETCGQCFHYNKNWDTAFGADHTQRAVLIGRLKDLPMEKDRKLNNMPKVFSLRWSTRINHIEGVWCRNQPTPATLFSYQIPGDDGTQPTTAEFDGKSSDRGTFGRNIGGSEVIMDTNEGTSKLVEDQEEVDIGKNSIGVDKKAGPDVDELATEEAMDVD